ncbi:hypothetical protein C0J52_26057, partial [Blattella germanica]
YLRETCTIVIYKKFVIFNGGLLVLVEARVVGPSGAGAGFPSVGLSLSKSLQFPDVLIPEPFFDSPRFMEDENVDSTQTQLIYLQQKLSSNPMVRHLVHRDVERKSEQTAMYHERDAVEQK